MKTLRLIFGVGILFITFNIGLDINYIYSGILLVIGLVLFFTSFGRNK